MTVVDVVVVSYNSRDQLRHCVEPLAGHADIAVIVIDNASVDQSLETISDLPVSAIQLPVNHGFAYGCNRGSEEGTGPFILLLNPDARIDLASIHKLTQALVARPAAAAVAPRVMHPDGSLDYSQRRFPHLLSTYARAVFLHRVFPSASWVDEVIRERSAYDRPNSPDWVSGACILLRRLALQEVEGLDERFFMYGEDKDLCRRLRDRGYEILYEPSAICFHTGGASASRATLLPVLAGARARYARKHLPRVHAILEHIGIGFEALVRVFVAKGGLPPRVGHARALLRVASRDPARAP